MNKNWPDDKTIQRYLACKLEGDALDELEAQIIDDPELLRHVQAEADLRAGLRDSGGEIAEDRRAKSVGLIGLLTSLVTTPVWSWSATAVACAALVLVLNPTAPVTQSPALIDRVVYVSETRSAAPTTTVIAADTSTVVAIDAIAWENADAVTITLRGNGQSEVFRSAGPGEDLQFYIPVADLLPGDYEVVVNGNGIERRYPLSAR